MAYFCPVDGGRPGGVAAPGEVFRMMMIMILTEKVPYVFVCPDLPRDLIYNYLRLDSLLDHSCPEDPY